MKRVVIGFLALIASGLFSYGLYLLNEVMLEQFLEIYESFGIVLPGLTQLVLSSLPFWKVTSGLVALISLLLVFTRGKAQYLSFVLPLVMGLVYLIALYLPILSQGAVV